MYAGTPATTRRQCWRCRRPEGSAADMIRPRDPGIHNQQFYVPHLSLDGVRGLKEAFLRCDITANRKFPCGYGILKLDRAY